jgi:hypothetical protein
MQVRRIGPRLSKTIDKRVLSIEENTCKGAELALAVGVAREWLSLTDFGGEP